MILMLEWKRHRPVVVKLDNNVVVSDRSLLYVSFSGCLCHEAENGFFGFVVERIACQYPLSVNVVFGYKEEIREFAALVV